eukprot:CAMPEP_0202045724 /NCGR_PEP_ID=MMETSP0963-20130614/896_1 /ASSEMBLY_ACC=CAM_ASM_000494 /TAXON_ID=4773 /ORGANISM="Schizochytrium aggregatum, Strain ATCC28209" /LENGTH=51 /DNA_ID=CAMNT_0048610339 /DNA_START=96 /DNA_END=248 /DNA_ORIENTATION=+
MSGGQLNQVVKEASTHGAPPLPWRAEYAQAAARPQAPCATPATDAALEEDL